MSSHEQVFRRSGDGRIRKHLWANSTWLLITTLVLLWTVNIALDQSAASQRQSRVSCERSKTFGPYLAGDYQRRNVLPPDLLREYRRTIPKNCP